METRTGYKLMRLRKDGTLGALFIGRKQRIPVGKWLEAEDLPTKGYAHRPGWHILPDPIAPHLSMRDRVWVKVSFYDFERHYRPISQGGLWYLAKWLRVDEILPARSVLRRG